MTGCPRLFEAEAMRDGRLGDAERASFARHAETCPPCSQEITALERLAEALREDEMRLDELHVRRERTRLLAAFDRELVSPPPPRARLWRWPALAAALFVGLFVFWRSRGRIEAPVIASSAVIQAADEAVWSKRIDRVRENVILERGTLRIQVRHVSGERPIMVVLPDGELEDTGTTFSVTAVDGHTVRVAVEEGSVVLRLHGRPPLGVRAGETWSAELRPAASAAPMVSAATTAPPSAVPPREPPPLLDPAAEFRAAMGALDRGENERAATELARFITKHPDDPRAEDAAYLRVIAFQRMGDPPKLKAAAADYLRRYPSGFRRAEVEPLAR